VGAALFQIRWSWVSALDWDIPDAISDTRLDTYVHDGAERHIIRSADPWMSLSKSLTGISINFCAAMRRALP
jgi:hypothetical protein